MNDSKDDPKLDSVGQANTAEPTKVSVWKQLRKALKRIALAILVLILAYLGIALIGLIPVNRDFVETKDGIEIFVFSGEFHSDLILPIHTDVIAWRTKFETGHVVGETNWATHMTFGWGDREFYLNTPSWSDLKISTATSALLVPSETVMHVGYETRPTESSSIRGVTISTEQYQRLVDFVVNSFVQDEEKRFKIIAGKSFYEHDAFYQANGTYHCFRTCNCWAGQAIKTAGIETGWFTPFPKTPFLYFPE